MDIPTIAAVISSIKSATDIAKLLKDTDLSLEKAEVKLKLADLVGWGRSAIVDTKLVMLPTAVHSADVRRLPEIDIQIDRAAARQSGSEAMPQSVERAERFRYPPSGVGPI